jgi:hypothetical protein
VTNGAERTRWKIRSDRTVDENPRIRLSVATLELADGTIFDQYVMRLPRCAMTIVLDDSAERGGVAGLTSTARTRTSMPSPYRLHRSCTDSSCAR